MPPRLRTIQKPTHWTNSTLNQSYSGNTTCKYFYESSYPGSNSCVHWSCTPGVVSQVFYDGRPGWHGDFGWFSPSSFVSLILPHVPYHELNREKLLTTSDFGLIQAIAEFDDTLAMFTSKLYQNFSYGGLTWGVMPFVQEVIALREQYRNLVQRQENAAQFYEDSMSYELTDLPLYGGGGSITAIAKFNGTVLQRYTGRTSFPGAAILEAFDRLGLHPDIQTAWDLVPLSFAVDWFLPIGDLLEEITQRGWIKAVNFTGWKTTKITGTITQVELLENGAPIAKLSGSHAFNYFRRDTLLHQVLQDRYDVDLRPEWSIPSPREIFNTAYLAMGFVRR